MTVLNFRKWVSLKRADINMLLLCEKVVVFRFLLRFKKELEQLVTRSRKVRHLEKVLLNTRGHLGTLRCQLHPQMYNRVLARCPSDFFKGWIKCVASQSYKKERLIIDYCRSASELSSLLTFLRFQREIGAYQVTDVLLVDTRIKLTRVVKERQTVPSLKPKRSWRHLAFILQKFWSSRKVFMKGSISLKSLQPTHRKFIKPANLTRKAAIACGSHFVNSRWLAGILTNVNQIFQGAIQLSFLRTSFNSRHSKPFPRMSRRVVSKFRRRFQRLNRLFEGIEEIHKFLDRSNPYLPKMIVFFNPRSTQPALEECKRLKILTVGFINTDENSHKFTFPITINTASVTCQKEMLTLLVGALREV